MQVLEKKMKRKLSGVDNTHSIEVVPAEVDFEEAEKKKKTQKIFLVS